MSNFAEVEEWSVVMRLSSPAAQNTVKVTDEKTKEIGYVLGPSATLHMSFIFSTAYEKWI